MSKCENCIHYEVCETFGNTRCRLEHNCRNFKDKSLCVELPCKVGDTVYMPWEWNGQTGIACLKVTNITNIIGFGWDFGTDFDTDDEAYADKYNLGRFYLHEIGKTVFLDRGEAEKKLKELGE